MKGDEAAKEKGMRIIVGCIVLGILIAVGPNVVTWLTQVDIENPSGLPTQLYNILTQLYSAMKFLGASSLSETAKVSFSSKGPIEIALPLVRGGEMRFYLAPWEDFDDGGC
ncbi:MAG: hypothetical protein QXS54_01085 [Candidatus Methanomethylicaceae archaeon]